MGGVGGAADWAARLRGRTLALDTAPLIYFIEEHPLYLPRVEPLFAALDRGEVRFVTSTVTLLEVLVQPIRFGDSILMRRYREVLLDAVGLDTIPVSPQIAQEAARLRAIHRPGIADAIQLATALLEGATVFLTNDARFPTLAAPHRLLVDEL